MSDDDGADGIAAGGLVAGVGGLVVVIGALLPWITAPASADVPRTGVAIFGPLVPIFGFAVLAGLLGWRWTTPAKFVAAVVGVIVVGLGVVVHAGTYGGGRFTPEPAIGLFVTMGGGALAAITASVSILLEDA